MGHVETGVSQELLELSIFHSVFVHDGGGGKAEFAGGAVLYFKLLTAFL